MSETPEYYLNTTTDHGFSLLTGNRVRLGLHVLQHQGEPFDHQVTEKTWNGTPYQTRMVMVFVKYPEGTGRDSGKDRVFCVPYLKKYRYATRQEAESARQNFNRTFREPK